MLKIINQPPVADARLSADLKVFEREEFSARTAAWHQFAREQRQLATFVDYRWVVALGEGLSHRHYVIEALRGEDVVGLLPLVFMRTRLFGRFLISLPYLDTGGVCAVSAEVAQLLVDQAVELADHLDVRFLELRHEQEIEHPKLRHKLTNKLHKRLQLGATVEETWTNLKSKVRNTIRNADNRPFEIRFGKEPLLSDFHHVFSHNMRDLGTPVFGKALFASMLRNFDDEIELACVYLGGKPIAAALTIQRDGTSVLPSASCLWKYRPTKVNTWMYWQLFRRAIERGQHTFDLGRSTVGGPIHKFKKQWGAKPSAAIWQYYVRQGDADQMRPDNGKFSLAQAVWKKLPLSVSRALGPQIVRGIP